MNDAQRDDALIGTLIGGRYRVVEKLGEGAMGAVYVAEHVRIGRRDAIKLLRRELATDAEAVSRFSRGARIVSAIRHPHVCSIYDFGDTEEGHQFLAMEYIPGGTLRDLLEREGRLPVARSLRIAQQIAGALQAAHDAGIIHRDLKPANVMLSAGRDGQDEIKVVDFDIAKVTEGGEEVTRLGYVVGTPEYMSPEQLMGEALDGRSDVYSLGLVLFRMLTGVLPFRASSPQDVMIERLTHSPLTLADVTPGVAYPEGLQNLISLALERRTADRCASAADFERHVAAVSGPGATGASARATPAASSPDMSSSALNAPPQVPPPTRVQSSVTGETAPGATTARPASPSRRLAVMAGGATVVLAAIATTVMLMNRDEPAPASSESSELVTADSGQTALTTPDREEQVADPPRANSPSGNATGNNTVSTDSPPTIPAVNAADTTTNRTRAIVIPVALADAVLDQQLFRLDPDQPPSPASLQATIDTATSLWRMSSLSSAERALAAYVIGSAHDLRRDWAACAQWLDSALVLNPEGRGYAELRTKCREMRE